MREIKFRAWDGNSMSDSFELDNKHTTFDDCKTYRTISSECLGWKIMQYTGLKDKHGKEIYESDMLLVTNDPLHLIYADRSKDYGGYPPPEDLWPKYIEVKWVETGFSPWFICAEATGIEIEIIGNRYENPELLDRAMK